VVSLPPLLTEYLVCGLEVELGAEIRALHQRASHRYASEELWTDAVNHAIAACDETQALIWIANCAMPLVKQGDLFTLLGWQRHFPTALSKPEVSLAIAWAIALALRYDDAIELLHEI
jgi:LuxR family transcriptional regulator, maltose regulon positive regulatory protein